MRPSQYDGQLRVKPADMPEDSGRNDGWHRHQCGYNAWANRFDPDMGCGFIWGHDGPALHKLEKQETKGKLVSAIRKLIGLCGLFNVAHTCPNCGNTQFYCLDPMRPKGSKGRK